MFEKNLLEKDYRILTDYKNIYFYITNRLKIILLFLSKNI